MIYVRAPEPTVLARITREELEQLLRGYGWTPYFVEGHEAELIHEAMAAALDATGVRLCADFWVNGRDLWWPS